MNAPGNASLQQQISVQSLARQAWHETLAGIAQQLGHAHQAIVVGGVPADDALTAQQMIEPLAHEPRVFWLRETFGLDDLDLAIVAIAMAPELELRFERLYAYIQDDSRKREARVDLALTLLCRTSAERSVCRARVAPDSALMQQRILDPAADVHHAGSALNRVLCVDPQIVHFLLYQDVADSRLVGCCSISQVATPLAAVPVAQADQHRLAAALATPDNAAPALRVYLRTDDSEQASLLAGAVATAQSTRLIECDLRRLIAESDAPQLLALMFREAWLRSLSVHLCGADVFVDGQAGALRSIACRELEAATSVVVLSGDMGWPDLELPAPRLLAIDGRELDAATRCAHWQRRADEAGIAADEPTLQRVAQRFRLRPGQISRAMALAGQHSHGADPASRDALRQALFAAARDQSGRRLATLASRVRPRYGWADIVLPPDALAQLHEICGRVAGQETVLGRWGFGRKLSQGKGTPVMFAGPSGTGKTMTAEVIANELGLDLYRINLANIVSKYIGETEKNLDRVFEAAHDSNAVLLFDEAEALFGKRSEVRDSHDRYANIEVAYLLQRLEAFDGLSILSTNLRQNLDEAFTRRLAFVVSFPFPEVADRQRLWEGMFPSEVPLAADIDFAAIAERFKLSGGNIKNVALSAAFLANEEGAAVGMRHLLHGTRREFQKQGKSLSAAELHLTAKAVLA